MAVNITTGGGRECPWFPLTQFPGVDVAASSWSSGAVMRWCCDPWADIRNKWEGWLYLQAAGNRCADNGHGEH